METFWSGERKGGKGDSASLGYLFTLEQRRRKYASHSLHCRTSSLLSSLAIPAHFPTTISFKPSSSSPAPPRSRPRRTPPFSQLPGHHIAINEGESSSKGANWGFASGWLPQYHSLPSFLPPSFATFPTSERTSTKNLHNQ